MILFNEIYVKAIKLFSDPKIIAAYNSNIVQFYKIMYSYLQNAIALFTNPVSVGVKIATINPPVGTMEVFEGNGQDNTFLLDSNFTHIQNSTYVYIENSQKVKGEINWETREVTFPHVLPIGQQYAFEQYYVGDFPNLSLSSNSINNLIVGEIEDILARLLVKAWAEEERNFLLDIRNLMQDSDFKITGNDKILKSKNLWVNQLDTEILQLQNKLAWNIVFMDNSIAKGV